MYYIRYHLANTTTQNNIKLSFLYNFNKMDYPLNNGYMIYIDGRERA
jgi:hypothetical protein